MIQLQQPPKPNLYDVLFPRIIVCPPKAAFVFIFLRFGKSKGSSCLAFLGLSLTQGLLLFLLQETSQALGHSLLLVIYFGRAWKIPKTKTQIHVCFAKRGKPCDSSRLWPSYSFLHLNLVRRNYPAEGRGFAGSAGITDNLVIRLNSAQLELELSWAWQKYWLNPLPMLMWEGKSGWNSQPPSSLSIVRLI